MKKRLSWLFCMLCLTALVMQAAAPVSAAPRKQARFARMAVLPVICLQEDIDYANTIVFQKTSEFFQYPDYEIYDGERLYKALDEVDYYETGKSGDPEDMLRTIMDKAGLDMIVMLRLNRLEQRSISGRESQEELDISMDIMAIYSWRPRVTNTRLRETRTTQYAAIVRTDWRLQEYAKTVNFYLDRISKTGKR